MADYLQELSTTYVQIGQGCCRTQEIRTNEDSKEKPEQGKERICQKGEIRLHKTSATADIKVSSIGIALSLHYRPSKEP